MRTLVSLLLVTLALSLPALLNGNAFLNPDSVSYIQYGAPFLHILLRAPFHCGLDCRSVPYTLAIFPFHWDLTLWPLVFAQSLAAAVMVLFTTARLRPGGVPWIPLALTILTPLALFTSTVMPDFATGFVILGLYWLGPGLERLSFQEKVAVTLVTAFVSVCHNSNWLLALVLTLTWWLLRRAVPRWMAMAVLLATLAQVGSVALLYGRLSLFANHAPFMVANEVEYGLAATYFRDYPEEARDLALYPYRDNLGTSALKFLWSATGVCRRCPAQVLTQIRAQEGLLVSRIVRHYPARHLALSLRGWARQMFVFDYRIYHQDEWVAEHIGALLAPDYLASRQAQGTWPDTGTWQIFVVLASLATLARWRLPALTGWILLGCLSNAAICGILSTTDGRYQARVMWLIPYAALLALRRGAQATPREQS